MKKSWLIAGLAVAGVLAFWLAGDDEPAPSKTAASAPTPIDSYYAAGNRATAAEAAVPQWRGNSVYSPAPAGGYSFRPLSEREKTGQPASDGLYPSQGFPARAPLAPQLQPAASTTPYAGPGGTFGYRFRPIDSTQRGARYTGNFPQPPDASLSGPVWPGASEAPGGLRSPWNSAPPPYGPGALWANAYGQR